MKANSLHALRGCTRYLDTLLVVVAILLSTVTRAQTVSQYTFAQSIGSFSAITGGTQLDVNTFDDEVYAVTGMTAFPFSGTYYTAMSVSANGFITFGTAPAGTNYTPLSSTATYAGAISAFGVDLGDAGSGTRDVRWQEVGNEIVVQWRRARRFNQSGETLDFQIRLNTVTGAINIVYNNSTPSAFTTEYPQVGLRGPNNTFATNVNNRRVDQTAPAAGSAWSNSLAGTVNTDVCRYNNSAPGRNMGNGQTYTWTPPCLPPTTSNAGADQTICIGASHVLAANTPSIGTGAWSINAVSGGATNSNAQFSSLASPTATFTPATAGVYTLRWTISNGVCTASTNEMVLTVISSPTTANAGPDQTVCASPGTATLAGNSITSGAGTWTKTSPGAGGTITTPGSPTTGVTGLTVAGSPYTFRWTATNSPCASNFDEMTITVNAAPTTANAGADQTICIGGNQVLVANVPSTGTGAWSINAVSGGATNNNAQFSSLAANNATFTPLTAGVYTLRWTISNGVCTPSVDDMVLTVRALPTTANAGPDQTVCASPGTATLAGNTITSGTGTWTKTSPGAGGTITTPGSPTTGVTGLTVAGSPYTFRWTATNSPCASNFDEMTITVNAAPTTANAGVNQAICAGGAATLAASTPAVGTAAWTAISGPNSSLAQLSSTSANNATFTPTTTGTYTLTWTTSNGVCANSTDQVVVIVNANPAVPTMTPTSATICAGGSTGLSVSASNTTSTFTGGAVTINASGSSPYPSTISVSGLPVTGVSVSSVTINGVTHNNPDDIDLLLRSPLGTNVVLLSDVGGSGDISGRNYVLQDGSPAMSDGGSNPTGVYAPTNFETTDNYASPGPGNVTQAAPLLSGFTGNHNGTWSLYAVDDNFFNFQNGSMSSWSITFSVPMSYAWTPVSGLSLTNSASTTATPAGTTNYTVTVTDPITTCQNSGSVMVTVVPTPNAGSNANVTVCSIDAPVDMDVLLGAHDAGTWTGPSAVVGDLYDPASMTPGNYVYTVTAAPCANATATISVTENTATPRYLDSDGDGFGDAGDMILSCVALPNRVSNNTDCNDALLQYADGDGDGFGAGSPVACGVASNSDCNDSQLQYADLDGDGFGAGAPVACGVSNNSDCNDAQLQYADSDGDGFGAGSPVACGVVNNADCNDSQLQYADLDGDGFGAGAPVACGVSNNSDCNDAQLQYADSDGDGFGAGSPVACGVTNNSDDCPTVAGLIGSTCDAQPGPGFVLGQLNGACACVATPCTENVVLELRSDANSSQLGWEILAQNTNLVICSGGAPAEPFPNGITSPIAPNCCLPIGCYRLRVLDAGGDGFVSGGITGGYQLRESGPAGRRIIDNMGNFTSGASSALASTYDNGAFCVPVGSDRPIFSSCDKQDWVNNKFIVATENPVVSAQHGVNDANSGYEFWFFDPNGSYSFRRFRSHATSDGYGHGATRACHFKINGWYNTITNPHIPSGVLLNVRIRGRVNGNNLPFGAACLFRIDPVRAACPLVKLQDNPLNTSDYSCGVTRVFGGSNSPANKLVASPPQFTPNVASNLVRYQFRFRIPGEYPNPGSCIVRPPQMSPALHLNWTSGDRLKCNTQYQVDVRVSKDGGATWCVADGEPTCSSNPTIWGKVCMVNITTSTFCPSSAQGGSSAFMPGTESNFTMYPNPNNGEQLFLSLTALEQGITTVNVDIFDMTGKRVLDRAVGIQDGLLNTTLELNSLQSGMYLVNITAGDRTLTERLVIQR